MKPINYLKSFFLVIGLFVFPFMGAAKDPDAPHVILFLIDDLGWADLGVTGSTFYETPHLDALAAEGVFFSNAYAANPVCSPTRASILTGKYPSRIGLTNHSGYAGPKGPQYKLNAPQVVGNMPPEDTTLAEAFKEAGYATAHIGKWHLAKHTDTDRTHYPENNGFDINIAGHKMGQPGSYYFPYQSDQHPNTNVPDLAEGSEGDYLTDALTDRAIQFIEGQNGKPFFLNMWYYTVHTPIMPPKEKLAKYNKKLVEMGLNKTTREARAERKSFSHAHQDNVAYACMIESMDENIGRILAALKRLDLEEDTLIVFLSDNGGLSTGTGPMSPTSSLPLRGGKAWVYEGGIRVPLMIKLPGKTRANLKVDIPVVSTDIYPTLLEMAGLPLRPKQHVDGLSLARLALGEADALDREALYFHYPHYHHINSMGPAGAIREGDYKLVEIFETGELELYNLVEDMGENNNLCQTMPELTQKLAAKLKKWRESSAAAMPLKNPQYEPDLD